MASSPVHAVPCIQEGHLDLATNVAVSKARALWRLLMPIGVGQKAQLSLTDAD